MRYHLNHILAYFPEHSTTHLRHWFSKSTNKQDKTKNPLGFQLFDAMFMAFRWLGGESTYLCLFQSSWGRCITVGMVQSGHLLLLSVDDAFNYCHLL